MFNSFLYQNKYFCHLFILACCSNNIDKNKASIKLLQDNDKSSNFDYPKIGNIFYKTCKYLKRVYLRKHFKDPI